MPADESPTADPGGEVAMIFEFWFDPANPEVYQEYLRESEQVRASLDDYEGFHCVERFQSTSEANKFVAIGFFSDEEAVRRWRTAPEHRRVQTLGRDRLFTGYRLRMANVTRDYDSARRSQAPPDSRSIHDTPTTS